MPWRARVWGLVVLVVVALLRLPSAQACGAFAGPRRGPTDADLLARTPYLAVEQTLIVWDKDTFTEDFIREARFDRTGEPFGFVVPTPGKPEISKVDESPFPALQKNFAFHEGRTGGARGGGGGKGGGAPGEDAAVEVLSQQRIGSFDVTVLRATEAGALDAWLAKNGFAMTTEAQPWLLHYVAMRFFFVAFRYAEAPPGSAEGMTSEVVRIRFKTAAPFYPYLEPEHPAGVMPPKQRRLSAWLVTQEGMAPVVNRTSSGGVAWKTPWESGGVHDTTTSSFLESVPALRAGFPIRSKKLRVHAFRDLRTSRTKLGDVLFAYSAAHDLSGADFAALRPLLPVLDPSIAPADPAPLDDKKRPMCAATVVGAPPSSLALAALCVAAALGAARRTRRRPTLASAALLVALGAALLLLACRREKPAVIAADNERAVFQLLSGKRGTYVEYARPTLITLDVTLEKVTFEPPVADVFAMLEGTRARIASCLEGWGPAEVDVDVDLVLDSAGQVTSVALKSATPLTPEARSCATLYLLRLKFGAPPDAVKGGRGAFRLARRTAVRE